MIDIKPRRKKKKLSQADLGRKIGVSRYLILDWEAGRKSPTVKQLEALSGVFECSVKDLILEE